MKVSLVIALILFVMAALTLWGGAYLESLMPWSDWRRFPSFVTLALVGVFSAGGCYAALDQYFQDDGEDEVQS